MDMPAIQIGVDKLKVGGEASGHRSWKTRHGGVVECHPILLFEYRSSGWWWWLFLMSGLIVVADISRLVPPTFNVGRPCRGSNYYPFVLLLL